MFVKPLVLTSGLLYVANKFYLGRGILVKKMTIMPTMATSRHHSWNDHHGEERAAQFHSEKPKVVTGANN